MKTLLALGLASADALFMKKGKAKVLPMVNASVTMNGERIWDATNLKLGNQCNLMPSNVIEDPNPKIEVCGVNHKIALFLYRNCEKADVYQVEVGTCDDSVPADDSCTTVGKDKAPWIGQAQSYRIIPCGVDGLVDPPPPDLVIAAGGSETCEQRIGSIMRELGGGGNPAYWLWSCQAMLCNTPCESYGDEVSSADKFFHVCKDTKTMTTEMTTGDGVWTGGRYWDCVNANPDISECNDRARSKENKDKNQVWIDAQPWGGE